MEYQKFDNKIYLRVDRGEEVLEKITEVALKENITLASVQAIGATDKFTVGLYSVSEKKYSSKTYEGEFEIVSLLGNITRKDDKPYIHLHIACGDENNHVFGGHLNYCRISATFECVITLSDGKITRKVDEKTGLTVFNYSKQGILYIVIFLNSLIIKMYRYIEVKHNEAIT